MCSSAASKLLVVLCVACAVGSARADSPDPEAARLFEEGRTLLKQGKVDEACERFDRSWKLDRAIGTQLNLADCHERHNELLAAWDMFDNAARVAGSRGQSERAQYARERADAIAKRLATIEIRVAGDPSDVGVIVDGKRLAPAPVFTHHTLGGRVEVTAINVRGQRISLTVDAVVGRTVEVELPAFGAEPPSPGSGRRGRVRMAAILGAGAGVVLVAGTFAWRASDSYGDVFDDGRCVRDFDDEVYCSDTDALQDYRRSIDYDRAGTALVLGGVGLAVAAVVVYLTAPRDRVSIVPAASSDAAGFAIVGRF